MGKQVEVRATKAELAEIVQALKSRIPAWIPGISFEFKPTLSFGIIGKCCHLTEHLFKSAVVLMRGQADTGNKQPPLPTNKLTLGDVCRLIKAQQKESPVFQGIDPIMIGETFNLLDKIVLLRNELVHMNIYRSFSTQSERTQVEKQLRALLDYVYELCDSWLVKKMLDNPGEEPLAVQIECPRCCQRFSIPLSYIGKELKRRCPSCTTEFAVHLPRSQPYHGV